MSKQILALIGSAILASVPIAGAAQTATPAPAVPAPAASTCAEPNVNAKTLSAVAPATPPLAQQQGISGDVVVIVHLDEQSRITSAVIAQTPSALLNNAALAAARAATFQTRIVNCRPIAAAYRFIVSFRRVDPSKAPSISDYFLGTWYCASDIKSRIVKAYGLTGGGAALTLDNAYLTTDDVLVTSQETYAQGASGLTVRSRFDGYLFAGSSSGWSGNVLVYTGPLVSPPVAATGSTGVLTVQRMTYTRADDDHFMRTFEWIPPGQAAWTTTSRETCARIAKPAP